MDKLSKLKKIAQEGGIEMATFNQILETSDLVKELSAKEYPEPVEEVTIKNLPEVQKVEITNFPKEESDKEELALLRQIAEELKKKEEYTYDIEIDPALKEQLKGDKGEDGIDGIDGKDGKDGTEITVEEIADKINSKKDIINASSIRGLIKTIEQISESRTVINTGSPVPTPSSKSFTYNPNGSLLTYTNGRGTKTFTYDSSGLLTNSNGTGVYNNWTFVYSNGKLSNVNLM
jgi:YD repeat-containing protein